MFKEFNDNINVADCEEYKFIVFLLSFGCRLKDAEDYIEKYVEPNRNLLENNSTRIKMRELDKNILLGGSKSDIDMITLLKNLNISFFTWLSQGEEITKYSISDVMSKFTFIPEKFNFLKYDLPISSIITFIDYIELKCMMFVNCCFIKELELCFKDVMNSFVDELEVAISFEDFSEQIEDLELNIPVDKLKKYNSKESSDMIERIIVVAENINCITDIFKSMCIEKESILNNYINGYPQNVLDYLNKWKVQFEIQKRLIDKLVNEILKT